MVLNGADKNIKLIQICSYLTCINIRHKKRTDYIFTKTVRNDSLGKYVVYFINGSEEYYGGQLIQVKIAYKFGSISLIGS